MKLLFSSTLLIFVVSAQGGNPVASETRQTLDQVAAEYLRQPDVLVQIKVTKRQLVRGQVRSIFDMMKSVASAPDGSTDDNAGLNAMLKMGWETMTAVRATDLTPTQKASLRRIVLGQAPLECLMTPELEFALSLKPAQMNKLNELSKGLDDAQSRAYKPKIAALQREVASFSKKFGDDPAEEDKPKALAASNRVSLEMADGIADVEVQMTPLRKKADLAALALLTSAQKRLYDQLRR